jgi:hypothetical protein
VDAARRFVVINRGISELSNYKVRVDFYGFRTYFLQTPISKMKMRFLGGAYC